jgi:hypothetical protein
MHGRRTLGSTNRRWHEHGRDAKRQQIVTGDIVVAEGFQVLRTFGTADGEPVSLKPLSLLGQPHRDVRHSGAEARAKVDAVRQSASNSAFAKLVCQTWSRAKKTTMPKCVMQKVHMPVHCAKSLWVERWIA